MDKPRPYPERIVPNKEAGKSPEKERQERVAKILDLVKKINESGERLPFPGIHPEAYTKIKIADNEFPGYTTPIDEIIERCEKEGIKVVTGEYPESGNVHILPAGSSDIEMDSIAPHQLTIESVQNEYLVELIRLKTKKEI